MSDSIAKPNRFSRRRLLQGAGGITLALPWLEKLEGAANAQSLPTRPKRVIVMTYEMGVPMGSWRPSATGASFTLPYVTAPLEPFKSRCLFVSSIDNQVLSAGGDPFVWGHPAKKEAALTGTLTTVAFPANNSNHVSEVRAATNAIGVANGPSVEHLISLALRNGQPLPSVDLGVDGDAVRNATRPETQPSHFFFEGRGNPITLRMNPGTAFTSLFANVPTTGTTTPPPPGPAEIELRKLRARKKSVLDAVRGSFRELSQGLGSDDRRRLEEHAARIRQIEIDTPGTGTPPSTAGSCSRPDGIATTTQIARMRMDQIAPLQIRILAHAMGCNLAPVGRIEFANQENPRFGIPTLDSTLDASAEFGWHGMVHGDPLPGTQTLLRPGRGASVPYDQRLLDGYRFFVQQFASLLTELNAIPEGPTTTVLDNSLVILASDLGEGLGHGHMKMGYILAGNLGSARRGYHFDAGPSQAFAVGGDYYYANSRYNVNQLLNSMLDMASVTDPQGKAMTMGLAGYLEKIGAPRRIDGLFA